MGWGGAWGGVTLRNLLMHVNGLRIGDPSEQAYLDRYNLAAALGELTKPDRFGAGVEVHVFEADIYDPSDGKGDFSKHGCPAPLSLLPVTPTDGFFTNWNAVVDDEVPMHGVSLVSPLHSTFYGHGVGNAADRWYANDCIHPNKKGHNELRRMFWTGITGEAAPVSP